MPPPMISIVLPTFNGSRYLKQAIESCIRQTCADWELIVVDDGSEDSTGDIAAEYARRDRRISVLRHDRNAGLPTALNTGFGRARGAYFTWISDDNIYAETAMEEMLRELESDGVYEIVYAEHYLMDADGNVTSLLQAPPYTRLVYGNCIGPCFLYTKRVHERLGGYDPGSFCAEDLDFWLRASIQFKMKPLPRPLMRYRRHPASLTSLRQKEILQATERVMLELLPRLPWATAALKAEGFLALAQRVGRERRYLRTMKHVARALRYSPRACLTKPLAVLAKSCLRRAKRVYESVGRAVRGERPPGAKDG